MYGNEIKYITMLQNIYLYIYWFTWNVWTSSLLLTICCWTLFCFSNSSRYGISSFRWYTLSQ